MFLREAQRGRFDLVQHRSAVMTKQLGDHIETFTKATGIEALTKGYERLTRKSCGCSGRKLKLSRAAAYRKQKGWSIAVVCPVTRTKLIGLTTESVKRAGWTVAELFQYRPEYNVWDTFLEAGTRLLDLNPRAERHVILSAGTRVEKHLPRTIKKTAPQGLCTLWCQDVADRTGWIRPDRPAEVLDRIDYIMTPQQIRDLINWNMTVNRAYGTVGTAMADYARVCGIPIYCHCPSLAR